ncbi:MAG: non-heme iron oxygenase ferredoxin subunit [Nocardioidaceae bacterium]|nr:non-heme iron oxygenase ferredoxin subunit [Nocardioidaceae bacterium]
MSFGHACDVADLVDGKPFATEVGDTEVVLVKHGEEVFALRDECSHAAIALSEGDVEDCTIECWLHGSRFDLRTGAALSLPAIKPVAAYPVRVDADAVLVDTDAPLTTTKEH